MADPAEDITDSVGESSQQRKRKQPATEVISSSGSSSELEESIMGSSVNGDQQNMFYSLSVVPKPTSCCLSERLSSALGASNTFTPGTISGAKTSPNFMPPPRLPSSSGTGFKFSLSSKPSNFTLPRKKRLLRQYDPSSSSSSPESPTTKFTLRRSPLGSLSTLSHGSTFSSDQPIPSFGNVASTSSGGKAAQSQMDDSGLEAGNCVSISAKPYFGGKSHEELRWDVYEQGCRGPLSRIPFTLSPTMFWVVQYPSFTFGSFPFGSTGSGLSTPPILRQPIMPINSPAQLGFGPPDFPELPHVPSLMRRYPIGFSQPAPYGFGFPQPTPPFPGAYNTSPPTGPNDFGGK